VPGAGPLRPAEGLRVLHVDTGRTWRGGQRQVFLLHRGLRERGVDSLLVCSAGGVLHDRARAAGLPTRGMGLRGEWDLVSAWRISRLARRWGAGVLHAHSSHAHTLALLARVLGASAPVVVTRRVDFVPRPHPFNRWKYGRADRIVAISRAVEGILRELGVAPDRIRRIPSGVEPHPVAPGDGQRFRRELGVAPDEILVGNVGHLVDHKGQRYLVDAVPRVVEAEPRARFVIVGEGELEGDLRAQAERLGLGDRLVFAGLRTDIGGVLDGLDVFVMSSHLEGLGTSVIDAMLAEKPVVAAAAGGIPDILRDGVDGVLVPPRDPEALARGILRVLGDPADAARMARAGRKRAASEFGVDRMVDRYVALYRGLTGRGPG